MRWTWKAPLSLAACLLLAAALIFFVARHFDLHIAIYRGDGNQTMATEPTAEMGDMSGHDHGTMAMSAEPADLATVMPDNAADAYAAAMSNMHGPMMAGMNNSDPDAAFILGMIPHHQGAIDMARVVLRFGKDDFTRHLAKEVIAAQEHEIAEMRKWLQVRGLSEAK